MALIDKSKLKYEKTVIQDSKYEEGDIVYWVSKDDIEKQPIVEAIPVGWLRNYIDKLNKALRHDEDVDPSDVWEVVALETLLEEWEKENEID